MSTIHPEALEGEFVDTAQEAQEALQPLAVRPAGSTLSAVEIKANYGLEEAEYTVLLRTVCKGAPREMAAFFMLFCHKRGLDPFSKQVYLWPDKVDYQTGLPVAGCGWNIVAGIHGLRAIASRSPYYRGTRRPVWEYALDENEPDGIKRFTKDESQYGNIKGLRVPLQCEVTALRAIPQAPADSSLYMEFVGIARFDEFVKTNRDGKIIGNWEKQPEHQNCVRAEALALRMAFPEEVGGIYTEDEMRDQRATSIDTEIPPPMEFDEEIRALAIRAGWTDAMLQAQAKRFGEKLLPELVKIVERTEGSARGRSKVAAKVEPTVAPEPSGAEAAPTPTELLMGKGQQGMLFALLGQLGITEKADRLKFAADAGIHIESFKSLTVEDATKLIDCANAALGTQVLVDGNEPCDACGQKPGTIHLKGCPESVGAP